MSSFIGRREIIIALGAAPLLAVTAASAQAPYVPEAGVDYNVVPNPQPTDAPGKVEVLDFFWYGCPHCYEAHTKIFYALQVLNRVDDMHVKVFDAFHLKHLRLNDRDSIADFMVASGIPRDKWLAAFDSFSVGGLVRRARIVSQNYTIDGTPTIAVDGRYLTSPSIEHTHTFTGTLGTMSFLVDRARQEHAHRKS